MRNRLLLVVPVLLFVVLVSGIYLPLYSDEVMSKLGVSRLFLEAGYRVSNYPQCTTTLGHAVSWVFYPAATLISLVYAQLEPLGLRVGGIVMALIWFSVLAFWCVRQVGRSWEQRFIAVIALGTLGVMPYLWVLSRPEQFMLLPILILSMVALYPPVVEGGRRQVAMVGVMAVLLSMGFYVHPKSVFFAPFFLVATWGATARAPSYLRGGLVLYVVLLALEAQRVANFLGACHDAPAVQALLSLNILRPSLLLESPWEFFMLAKENLLRFFPRVMEYLAFAPNFQSGWLPPLKQTPAFLAFLNDVIKYGICALIAFSHVWALGAGALALLSRRLSIAVLLALLIAVADLGLAMLYNIQNFYAAIHYVPLSIIVLMLLLHERPVKTVFAFWEQAQRVLIVLAAILSVTSMTSLMFLVLPSMIKNAGFPNASIPGQPLSVPIFNASEHLDSIRELGRVCRLPEKSARFLVVDHMTYFAYKNNRQPAHVLYVSELGYGLDLAGGKLLPFLKTHGSPGLITRCEWVPKEIQGAQQQNERGYCCVNFDAL